MKALRVGLDATVTEVDFDPDNFLKVAYEAIGCDLVECVAVCPTLDMWIDESGALKQGREINHMAMYLLSQTCRRPLLGPIYGNVLLTGGPDPEGETREISPIRAAWVRELLA